MKLLRLAGLAFPLLVLAGVPQDEAIQLFNGRDLSNLYAFLKEKGRGNDPGRVFSVADGLIRVSGAEYGYIATEKEFENYHLTVEFKWGAETHPPRKEKARDSGLLFHFTGDDKIWPKSLEFQIIEGGTGDIILVGGASMDYDEALKPLFAAKNMVSEDGKRIIRGRINWPGRSPEWKDVAGFRGREDLEKPVGEWNILELLAEGGSFIYRVNGKQVVKGTGAQPAKGKILLQSEGAELFFRRIELRPLRKR